MEKQTHLAAQYLAAAGISFLDKRADDSHTNLGFDADSGLLSTHLLSDNNDTLSLDYKKFTLEWHSLNGNATLRLDGATHTHIVNWITEVSKTFLEKEYSYKFHYDLPYKITDDFTFKLNNVGELQSLMHLRIFAQFSLERILKDNKMNTTIRIWPHHFDTGIYDKIPNTDISIGCGLAIPDTICNEHYLYISGYKDGKIMETNNFKKLKNGEWYNDGFKGAFLPAKDLIESESVYFFQEAINQFKNYK